MDQLFTVDPDGPVNQSDNGGIWQRSKHLIFQSKSGTPGDDLASAGNEGYFIGGQWLHVIITKS